MEGRGRVFRARVVGRAGLIAGGDEGSDCGGGGLGGEVMDGLVGLSRAEAARGSRAEGGGGGGRGRSGLSGAGGEGGGGGSRGAPFRRSRASLVSVWLQSLVSAWLQREARLGSTQGCGSTGASGILTSGQMSVNEALPPARGREIDRKRERLIQKKSG